MYTSRTWIKLTLFFTNISISFFFFSKAASLYYERQNGLNVKLEGKYNSQNKQPRQRLHYLKESRENIQDTHQNLHSKAKCLRSIWHTEFILTQIFSKTPERLETNFSGHAITRAVANTKERSYLIPVQTLDSFLSQWELPLLSRRRKNQRWHRLIFHLHPLLWNNG